MPNTQTILRRAARLGILGGLVCVSSLTAAVVSVTDAVSTFSTLENTWGGALSDATGDQQTGQYADDFVGDGTNGHYGFYYKYGQIGTVDTMVFRVRLNEVASSFTGNIRMGVDGDGDGSIDLYFGISTGSGQVPEITFQNPTGTAADANTSPNTSALGTSYGTIATTSSNYSYVQANDGSSFGSGNNLTPNPDAFLTWAIPFSTFKTYLEAQLSGVTITPDSMLRFLAFSSTQGNSVNQDIYGATGISKNTRFDQGGGFTNYYSASGKVIPEASTAVQTFAFLLSGLGVVVWRRPRSSRARAT